MIEHAYYLTALVISLAGLLVVDGRFKLAFFYDWRRTLRVVVPTLGIFILWDGIGIASGIFRYGKSDYSLGLMLAPEFPVEEIVFLLLLIYSSLILYRILSYVHVPRR